MAEVRTRRRRSGVDPARETSDGHKVIGGRGNQTQIRPSPGPSGAIGRAVDRFYAEALLQSRVWFLASVLAALVGMILIVWEVVQATGRPDIQAALKAATGLLVDAVAALFYSQADATRKHAANLLARTDGDRRSEMALTVLNSIEDVELREEIAARLVMHLAGRTPAPRPASRPSRQDRRSAPPEDSRPQAIEPPSGRVEPSRRRRRPACAEG